MIARAEEWDFQDPPNVGEGLQTLAKIHRRGLTEFDDLVLSLRDKSRSFSKADGFSPCKVFSFT
jgi:hypothetical protein